VQTARVALAVFLFFLALLGGIGAFSGFFGESEDTSRTVRLVLACIWLASGVVFAIAGALLLSPARVVTGRTVVVLAAVLVVGAVILNLSPFLGGPVTALAALAVVVGFAPKR
jgi:ABC-type transport system involved in multi-copper enzyme maturation permease subunit